MYRSALIVLLALLPSLALAAPARVDEILEHQRVHGYHSLPAAIEQLQSASDVPTDNAPLDLRRRYHGALARLSSVAGDSTVALASQAKLQAMADLENCQPCRVQALLARGQLALAKGHIEAARGHVAELRPLVDPADQGLQVKLGLFMARLEDSDSNLAAAVEHAVPAVALAEKRGNTADRLQLMIVLVGLNADLGHVERAGAIAAEGVVIAKRVGFDEALGYLLLNQGHIHALTGQRDQQYKALAAALQIAAGDPGLAGIEVTSRSNLADYYLNQGNNVAALDHASRATALARTVDDQRGLTVATANEGIALSRLGRVQEGIDKLNASIDMAGRIGHKGYVVGITHELVLVLEKAGRYREALDATQQVAALNREITRQERERAVMELQEKYAAERRNREIERLEAENRLKEAEVRARTWQQRLWVAMVVALLLAAFPVLRRLVKARHANRRLKAANANLAEQSAHDPLTGVFNRRHFQALMAQHGIAAGRGAFDGEDDGEECVGLVLLDIDHFKAINDTRGHVAGDLVLVEVARRLQGLVRDRDAVVRWGGEEFVLVLPGASVAGLAVLAPRILRTIGSEPVRAGNAAIDVTVSAGCVAFPVNREKRWEDALQLADAAMYLAKQRGRNRAVCVTAVREGEVLDAISDDLATAEASGRVSLLMLPGPSRPVALDVA
ncbi:GGDEF domain-containing protein [Novilysobacter erysipheiresistens]|uniref:diguanylate cyclase n=1 Tax=Novilysobacter erysipheiresistens TaxID=1749332 RepID=A0ABU7Z0R3_9GAMM